MTFHKLIQRLAATPFFSRLLAPILHRCDAIVLGWTGGRLSLSNGLTGLPLVVLTSLGARTGQARRLPLFGLPDGERIILIASSFGRAHAPGWYYNLKAHPQATLTLAGRTRSYLAHEAEGEERERYWQLALAHYAGYGEYARRASHRRIPVMVLVPA